MSKARYYSGLTLKIISVVFHILPEYALAYVKYASFRSSLMRELKASGIPKDAAAALAGEYSPMALIEKRN